MTTKKPYIINKFVFCEKDGRDMCFVKKMEG